MTRNPGTSRSGWLRGSSWVVYRMDCASLTPRTTVPPVAAAGCAGIVAPMGLYPDDIELMRRYARGDVSAFERLYEKNKGPLFRYLVRQTRSREAAEDLFQEVWSRVIASRARYAPLAKFSTFLFSIAHNCFIDHCRRSAHAPTARADALEDHEGWLSDSPHRGPERQADSQAAGARMRAALARLPDEQREVFVLHEESGLSLHEIGELTGVGMETAKSRLRYAVAKLRQSLASDASLPAQPADIAPAEAESR
jgi:RNA polymerase sigma-70 factor, ECF subfamily